MTETIRRVVTYTVYRVVALALTVVVGVYLAILIANMGGYVDQIRKAQIDEAVGASVLGDRSLQGLPPSELRRIIDQRKEIEYKRLGLDKPFLVRSFAYLWDALTLNLGRAEQLSSDSGSRRCD
jgi:peptide/nickel transport system permease protein